MIAEADEVFTGYGADVEYLVSLYIDHWSARCSDLCPGDWCAGPLFDELLEELDSDELRGRLQAAVWYLAKLRTLPGA